MRLLRLRIKILEMHRKILERLFPKQTEELYKIMAQYMIDNIDKQKIKKLI